MSDEQGMTDRATVDRAVGAESGDYGLPLSVALERMRALAACAAAAQAELDAMDAGALDSDDDAETQTLDRLVRAQDALVLTVCAAGAGLALLAAVERGRARVGAALEAGL